MISSEPTVTLAQFGAEFGKMGWPSLASAGANALPPWCRRPGAHGCLRCSVGCGSALSDLGDAVEYTSCRCILRATSVSAHTSRCRQRASASTSKKFPGLPSFASAERPCGGR